MVEDGALQVEPDADGKVVRAHYVERVDKDAAVDVWRKGSFGFLLDKCSQLHLFPFRYVLQYRVVNLVLG